MERYIWVNIIKETLEFGFFLNSVLFKALNIRQYAFWPSFNANYSFLFMQIWSLMVLKMQVIYLFL